MKNKKRGISVKLIRGVIALLVLVAVLAGVLIATKKEQVIENNSINDPEIARAMTYDRVQEGDEVTNSDCVEFDAFFLRDLDGDGYAEGIRGTCREAGKTDTLYMELRVIKDGYLKNAKITVNNENFYLSTSIPKDEQIAKNAISENTKEIVFNDISNGTQKLLTGTVKSSNSSYYKATAVGKDINKLSKPSSIVLSGTHVGSDGTETEIEKVVNFNVDWYGEAKTRIPYSVYYDVANMVQSKEIRECIDEENNTITLDFDIYTEEYLYELNLKKSVIYGEIPQLGEQDPIDVQITGTNVTFSYDSSNRQYQAKIEATLDEEGKILQNAYTDTYNQSRYSKYNIQVTYDLSAYYAMASKAFEYVLPVNAYYEAFNNSNEEFDDPYVTNVASNVSVITFEEQKPRGKEGDLRVDVGDYLYSPTSRYVVSKKKPSYIYNGIDEEQGEDTYRVTWNFYTGTEGIFEKLTLKEGEENGEKVYDDLITTDGRYISAKDFSKYAKIEFKNADKLLGDDGWIKVYDDETDEVIATFDKNNWSSVYTYETPVRSVRVETSKTNVDVNFYVYHTKVLDDNYIVENFTKEQFDEFKYIRTRAESYTDGKIFKSATATAHYEAQLSVAYLSVRPNTITSQETEKNEILTITTECNNSSNEAYWKNGMFLIKLPSEIIQANINSVTTSADGVNIDNYEVYKENGNYFIKVITSNSEPTTFSIVIDAKITPDPRITTISRSVEMWAINAANENYYYAGDDIYDINGNKNTKETIGKYNTSLVMVSPNALLTNQTAYNFNQDGTVVVAPQVAYVEKEQREATINIQIKNNYSKTISDINILGKIPYEGNTYVINKDDLGSDYSTTMEQSGIHVPDDIKDTCEVYYSYEDEPTKDLDKESNGWLKTPDDFSKVKSYLIVLKDYVMAKDETKDFYYTVNLPQGIDYNDISYSHYGVYFSLDTDNGKYRTQTEPNKLGLMIAKQYNLEIIKSQTDKEKKVEGASYSLQEEGSEDAVTKFTDENGKAVFEDILLERVYTVREVISPKEYELNEGSFKFIAHEVDGTIEIEKIDGDVVSCDTVKNEGEDPKVVINVEDDVKANVKITKIESGSVNKLKSARYKLTGKNFENGSVVITDENGEATLTGLSLGEEYTLEEIKAPKGYYLNNDPIKFSVVNNNGKIELVKTEGTTKSEDVVIVNEIPTINFTIEDEKIPTYDLTINKVSKGDKTPLPGVQFRLYYGKKLLGTYESDDNGQILITGLYRYVEEKQVEQKYTLKEIYAPEGYAKIKDIEFYAEIVDGTLTFKTEATSVPEQLSENENSLTITVEDAKSFKLTKVDGETAEVLPGTKFVIYNIDNGKSIPAVDSKGNTVGTLENINGKDYYVVETNEQGEISANLPEGLYKAVEVQACDEKYDISKVKDTTYYFGIGASRVGSSGELAEDILNAGVLTATGESGSYAVCGTADGGFIEGGYFNSSLQIGDSTESSRGGLAGQIIKYSTTGDIEWYSIIDGDDYDCIWSVAQTNDGGYIVGGDFDSTTVYVKQNQKLTQDMITITNNYKGALIIKYSENGIVEWYRKITGGSDDYVFSVKQNEDGTYIVGGRKESSTIDFGNNVKLQGTGGFVAKYDSEGNALWAKRTTGIIYSAIELNGGYIAGGERVLVYYDSNGEIVQTKSISGTIYDVTQNNSGGYLIAGNNIDGQYDVISYNSNNEIEKQYDVTTTCRGIYVDSADKILACGLNGSISVIDLDGNITTKSIMTECYGVTEVSGYGIVVAGSLNGEKKLTDELIYKTSRKSIFWVAVTGGAGVPEQSEILAENYRKQFSVTTDIEEIDGVKGGTISGEDMTPYEKVKYGDSSTQEIKMVPNDEYEIISITLNGEEYPFTVADDGSFTMPQFDNVQENKRIVVKFAKSSNKLTINKTDEITGERLSGVKFQIDQVEERADPEVDLTGLTGNSSAYQYPDLDNEISPDKGELTANGAETLETIDEITDFNFGELTNNGTYYFIKNDDDTYTPTNSKTYQVANGGTAGKQSTTANSYIPIDLTGLTGKYAIKLSASCVSEGSCDYGYATITESTTAPSYGSSTGRFVYISGTVNEGEYTSYSLDGGKVYYLHLGYRKDGSVDTGADQIVIKDIKLYSTNVTTFNFVENNGKYESNNQGCANTTAASYVPIDLTGLEGEYAIVVDASVSSEASYDYGYVNVREDTNRSTSNNIIQISGTKTQEGYKVVNGGKMYYVHFGYLKNASKDVGDDKFTINSIRVYGARSEQYNFVEEDGVYKSTNEGKPNTYARSYIPIDLTGYVGKYNLIVNAEISSESSYDYGYLIANTSTSQTTSSYFARISGTVAAKDYQTVLTGGKVYYLHMVYSKNASNDKGDDQLRINSVRLELNDSDLYHTTAITNSLGEATAQIPYGLYNITEIEPLDGYELADPVEYRMENGKDNIVNITNKPLGRVVVHHYLLDSFGNETTTKLADDEGYSGKDGEIYTTVPRVDIDGYMLKRVDGEYVLPTNREGTYQAGQTIEVNYYYQVANYELTVHHYIEGTNTPVPLIDGSNAEDEKFEGKPGETYVTNKLADDVLNAEYELTEEPRNKTGVYEDGDIEVTYYYKIIKRNITLMKYDEDGATPLSNAKFSILNKNESKRNKISVGKLQNNGTYGFAQSNGKYVSNNTKQDSTVANSYITIDLTQETENVEITVNAQVSSEGNYDYGYATITESIQTPAYNNADGQFISISGSVSAKDYKTVITPGKIYYLHLGYRKDGSQSSGSDCFIVNSILINGKDLNWYGEGQYIFETDSNGMISTELEAGTYEISEVQAPEGYDLEDGVREISITRETPETIEIIDTKTRGNVITHHYIEGTTDKVLLIDGTYVDDEEQIGVVGDMYATREKDDIVGYEYVSSTDNTSGQYIDGTIEVTYYYRLLNYKYTVNYLEKDINEQIHESKDVLDVPYMTIINSLDEIIDIDGYNYDSIDSENIQITENENTNVINVYYTKRNDLSYTVNYLEKDTNKVIYEPKTTDNMTFEDEVTSINEVIEIDGYNYDSVDKNTLVIGTGENIINVYYTKRNDLSYRVNYLEKDTNKVLSNQKIVENVTFEDEITSANEVIAIDGYNYDSVDKDTLKITTGENVIDIYYTKRNDLSYKVNYLEKTTNKVLHEQKVVENMTFEDEITSANEVIAIDGYNYDSVDKDTLKITTGENVIDIYYTKRNDLSYKVNYLEKTANKVLHEQKVVENVTFEDEITSANEVITIDGYNYDSVDKDTLKITTGENVINIYYTKRNDLSYTVNYLEKTTNKVIHAPKVTGNMTFEDEVTSVNEVIEIDGYNYDSVDKDTLVIGTGENIINIYYTKRNDLSYKVNYLEKDTNKIIHEQKIVENMKFEDEIASANEVITIDGYNYDSVDKETMKITTGENVINIYYTKRTDLNYTVNYLEKTTNKVLHDQRVVENVTFEDEITSANEVIAIDGYNYDSVDKDILKITTGENIINIYYTKRTDLSYKVNYLEKTANKVLHEQKVVENMTFEDEITSANEVITIDGYNYDSVDKATMKITTGENVINIYYTKRNDLSYTVNYLEKDTNKVLSAQKSQNGMTFEDEITSANEVITIDGYNYDSVDKDTLVIGTNENVINIYYTKRNDLSYTVNYLEKNTNKVIYAPKVTGNMTFEDEVTSVNEVIEIDGYNYDSVDKATLKITTGENIINVYYTKRNDLSYTVNYIEKDTNKMLHEQKTQGGMTFEDEVTSVNEVIEIDGYDYDSVDKNTLVIGTGENIINIYYTKRNDLIYKVNYLEKDTNRVIHEQKVVENVTFEDEITSANEVIAIDGYNYDSVDKDMLKITTGENIINIYYTKRNDLNYKVNYLEKDTNKVIHDQKVVENVTFEDEIPSANEVITIYGYNYDSVDKDVLKITTGENVINIYYTKKEAKVTVHYYEENSTNKVSEDREITGKVNDEYTTAIADDIPSKYELVAIPANATGTMTEDTIEVIYYFRKKATQVIVRHYEEGTTIKLSADVTIEGRVDDPYTTVAATDVPIKYELSVTPANVNGTMTENTIEVIYYYRVKDAVLNIRYLEKGTEKELAQPEQQHGKVDEEYITGAKTIDGYTLVEHSGNERGKFEVNPLTVTYYYLYNTRATVQYIDKITGQILEQSTTEGLEGDDFVTESKSFDNYILVEEPAQKTVKMTKEEQVLRYYYIHVSGGVIEKHIDMISGEILSNDIHQGNEGDIYDIKSKTFNNYDLVEDRLPENAQGTMTVNPIEVVYYYIYKSKVTAQYVDKNTGEKLTEDEVQNGHEKDAYITDRKTFDDYKLVEVPANADGEMTKKDITVTYNYVHTSGGVIVNHVDVNTNKQLLDETKQEGYEGDPYETHEENIPGYTLVKEKYPANAQGTMAREETRVTYYYVKNTEVNIKYIDKETGEEITEKTNIPGKEGDNYTTEPKDIPGYDLVEEPINKDGTMTAEPIDVIYYYRRPAKVITRYIDQETNEEIATEEKQEGHQNDEYTTETKDIKYYKLIATPDNATGTMKVTVTKDENGKDIVEDTTYVTYYYRKLIFNLNIDKKVSSVTVNGEESIINGDLGKVEVHRKELNTAKVEVKYIIKVTNDSELTGKASILEDIPTGMIMNAEKNAGWEVKGTTATRETKELNPGESEEYLVVLDWENGENNIGMKENTASIISIENEAGFEEKDTTDNEDKADVIVAIGTGGHTYVLIAGGMLLILISLACGVYIIKRENN